MLGAAPLDQWPKKVHCTNSRRRGTRNPARRGPLSTPHLHSSTHMPSSCRHWICCGIGGIALCSRGTALCSLRIAPLVYTINSAALHQSCLATRRRPRGRKRQHTRARRDVGRVHLHRLELLNDGARDEQRELPEASCRPGTRMSECALWRKSHYLEWAILGVY